MVYSVLGGLRTQSQCFLNTVNPWLFLRTFSLHIWLTLHVHVTYTTTHVHVTCTIAHLASDDCKTCKCNLSAFFYQPLDHVVNGDFSVIITDGNHRHLIRKGPHFREQNNINWDLCLKLWNCAWRKYVLNYRDRWVSRKGVLVLTYTQGLLHIIELNWNVFHVHTDTMLHLCYSKRREIHSNIWQLQ